MRSRKLLNGAGRISLFRLFVECSVVFHVTVLKRAHDSPRRFDETFSAFAHIQTEAIEFNLSGAASDTEYDASTGNIVEHGNFLRRTQRIMPGQQDYHRAKLCRLRAFCAVGQKLVDIGAHGVVGEVVLDAPD